MTLPSADDALRPETWRALLPHQDLDGTPAAEHVDATLPDAAVALADLRREGYLNHAGVLPLPVVAPLAEAVRRLVEQGIPPVFLWLFDAPWRTLQAFDPFLRAILGAEYRVLPEIWTWFVPPTDGAAGWRAHRDQPHRVVDADGTPHSLTLWLPLTDATLHNGCMHLVPRHLDGDFGRPGVHLMVRDPHAVHPQPAPAGSMLMWNQNLLHWGGSSSRLAAGPRISIGCQFQRARQPILGRPLLPPLRAPGFELRVFLVARAILGYGTMTPIPEDVRELAQALKDRLYERIANEGR